MRIQVDINNSREIIIHIPTSDGANVTVKTVPGIKWDGTNQQWVMPITRRSVDAFRTFLQGREYALTTEAVEALKAGASMPQPYDLTLSNDKKKIIAKLEYHKSYEEAFKSAGAKVIQRGHWEINVDNIELLLYTVKDRNLDINIHPDITALANEEKSLDKYSGYLAELHRFPIEDIPIVKKDKRITAKKLKSHNIENALDLLRFFPLRYIDRTQPILIKDLVVGETASILGTIESVDYRHEHKMTMIKVNDASGKSISVTFFRQPWLSKQYHKGDPVVVYGKFTETTKNGRSYTNFSSPSIDKIGDRDRSIPMVPVYPQSQKNGITTWNILKMEQDLSRHLHPELVDSLPESIVSKYKLISRHEAYQHIHIPTDPEMVEQARRRLIYEELFLLQVLIQQRKALIGKQQGIAHTWDEEESLAQRYLSALPYTPTNAQMRAMEHVDEDLKKDSPAHRLIQGDVGSGKSTIASWAMLRALDSGYQGALMAPTEILAEQLHNGIKSDIEKINLITGRGINVAFLGNKTKVKEKREVLAGLEDGSIDIVVGTHSLISENVKYNNLGVIVIDEQHRFGAEQRTALKEKREDNIIPDVLVMTATPIPRTSSLVLYGDMDITVLDELPPGRTPIHTTWIEQDSQETTADNNAQCWEDIRNEVAKGHQAYVVSSLVEESETIAAASAEETLSALQNGPLKGLRIGLVHGKLSRSEREENMKEFSEGSIDVIVATSVIEVGVNVPNSTIMVILDANRFGIAQLHQIRGRVGRSSLPSRCYLVGSSNSDEGIMRLNSLVESTDGFYLAEKDLEIRGSGQLFGTQQSGESDLKIASLTDSVILECAMNDAKAIIEKDPYLQKNLLLAQEVSILFPHEIHI